MYAYANRTLVNTYLADRRRRRSRELVAGWLPDHAAESGTPELRMVVLDALATLPPKMRVMVVMRDWAKTAYVLCNAPAVVPISVATDTAERPIGGIHSGADALVIAP